jgi:hypothetical protein
MYHGLPCGYVPQVATTQLTLSYFRFAGESRELVIADVFATVLSSMSSERPIALVSTAGKNRRGRRRLALGQSTCVRDRHCLRRLLATLHSSDVPNLWTAKCPRTLECSNTTDDLQLMRPKITVTGA